VSRHSGFVVRSPGDDITDYLHLVHEPCETVICWIEPGDEFVGLLRTVGAHVAECRADAVMPPPVSTPLERARLRRALSEMTGE